MTARHIRPNRLRAGLSDHDHRAGSVVDALLGHGAEQEPNEAAVASGADDEQVGSHGGLEEDPGGRSLEDASHHVHSGIGADDPVHHVVQHRGGFPLEIGDEAAHLPAGQLAGDRERPGVDDLQGRTA